ncbi:hypothetical protein ABIA24_004277 [Sinorhizobium fredii]|uniref:Uncharacterized protein n=1 Tax=Sinorhizobium fredii (strain HH103) TaxID=1117943 RepID=G9AC32_SINF1|nr:hypothetical protein [Sinorhizobium fredii]MCK3780930.1 hypothetical protein [Ensifer sesbaniae]MQW95346.1 hypothetical protein [Sinorhizobium fredii]UTY47744.1 hypothetical protein EPK84_13665 [Sinorhizobium fredii]CCE98611.1 hypothetical protein SFHH103_04121 [Sinorhizobium fredii HH103]
MCPSIDFYSLPLSPDDLDTLQRILDRELEARHISNDSDEAGMLARTLIELFQTGVRGEDALREMVKAT